MTESLTPALLAAYLASHPWTGYTKPAVFEYGQKRGKISNGVWIRLPEVSSSNGSAKVFDQDEFYEVWSYTNDFTAWNEMLRILRRFPDDLYFNFFNAESDVSDWTETGAASITSGKYKFPASACSASRAFTGQVTSIEFKITFGTSGYAENTQYFYKTGTGTVGLLIVEPLAGNLICYTASGNVTLDTPLEYNHEYTIKFDNFTGWGSGAFKCDIYCDGVLKATQQTLSAGTITYHAIFSHSNSGAGITYIDDLFVFGTAARITRSQKQIDPRVMYMGQNSHDEKQGVWRFSFKHNKLESVD